MTMPLSLVQGRECGECTACCEWLWVDTPEFDKPPSMLCQHAGACGCRIYSDRPSVCRLWFCGWRRFGFLPEDWRPDRSGVIAMIKDTEIPVRYEKRTGFTLLVFWPVDMALSNGLGEVLSALLDDLTPIFLALPGPPGFKVRQFFANDLLDDANRARDFERFRELLLTAFEQIEKLGFEPITLADGHVTRPAPHGTG